MLLPACAAPAPVKVTEWRLIHINPTATPPHPEVAALYEFIDTVWEKSGQTVKIKPVAMGEMGYKGPEVLPLVRDGGVAIANTASMYYPEEPLLGLAQLFLQFRAKDIPTGLKAARPYFEQVWAKHNVILLGNGAFPNGLWSRMPITKLEDFKGKKFRATEITVQKGWGSVGGASVTMGTGDVYMGLQTGIIDAAVHGIKTGVVAHYYEVAKYAVVDPIINAGNFHLIVNKAAFNALPKKTQDAIIEAGKQFQRHAIEWYVPSDDDVKFLKAQGVTTHVFSDAELARLRNEMAIPVWKKWAAEKGVTAELDAVNKALGL